MILPIPTTRAVIDPLRKCNMRCRMCYHLHTDMKSIDPLDKTLRELDAAKARGNDYIDITGGQPTIHPHIVEIINYIHNKNMKCCIITNAIDGEEKTNEILSIKPDELLISIHGLEQTHDWLTQHTGARQKQIRFMNQIKNLIPYRFNFVIAKFNQHEIFETAEWMLQWNPNIVNFINFNPHHEWSNNIASKDVMADLRTVEPILNKSIKILEDKNIGVNVRYYPMCRIHENYRRCICNDLHVVFDPYEWDYSISPKTFDAFRKWGIAGSKGMENKGIPCNICDLQWICGGINTNFHKMSNGTMVDAVRDFQGDKNNFYHYRENNILTLQSR